MSFKGLLFVGILGAGGTPSLGYAIQVDTAPTETRKVERHQQRAKIQKLADRKAKKKRHPKLILKGGSSQLRENIRNTLDFGGLSCQLSSLQRTLYQKKWEERAMQASRALGYYHASREWETEDDPRKNCWKARLTITAGKRTRFHTIDVAVVGQGADLPEFQEILASLPIENGEPVKHQRYEQLKSSFLGAAQRLGFRDARFDHKALSIHLDNYTADVQLVFNTGERYQFGDFAFDQEVLDDAFLHRYLKVKTGDPFEFASLAELQQALTDSRYFTMVDIQQLAPNKAMHQIPIRVHLTPAKRRTTAVGIGYSSEPQPSPRLSLNYNNRRVNQWGHKFNVNVQTAFQRQTVTTDYYIPLKDPRIDQLKLSALWEFEETQLLKSYNRSLGAAWIKRLSNQWQKTLDLTLLNETFEFNNLDELRRRVSPDARGELDAFAERTSRFLLPGVGWQKTQSNDLFYPTQGWRASFNIKVANELLLSDTSMTQFRLSAKRILSMGSSRFHARVDLGLTRVDDFSVLPASLRFFAGGDNSVRGYAFESLSPTSNAPIDIINRDIANGDFTDDADTAPDPSAADTTPESVPVGGRHLLTASVEWDHPIWQNVSGALFFDAGNAFNDRQFTLKQSMGFGFRWRSPVGPIRMDFAFPIDDDQVDFRFHLALGRDL